MTTNFDEIRSPAIRAVASRKKDPLKWLGCGRAYPDPELLIAAITDPTHRLAAKLQLEGGLRAEGVGSPRSPYSSFRITEQCQHGIFTDPYFDDGRLTGVIEVTEKGGYTCRHYVSVGTYRELAEYVTRFGALYAEYDLYLASVNRAAKLTAQYVRGRGTHGLKHCFAQRFFLSAVAAGKSRVSAEVETSRRCAHHRGDVFRTSYSGRR
jgi:hypothetical protein